MAICGEAGKRYYVVGKDGKGEDRQRLLVEAIPDPTAPLNPEKDSKTGQAIVDGKGTAFWTDLNTYGFAWVERSFRRYWVYDPSAAARNKEGQSGRT